MDGSSVPMAETYFANGSNHHHTNDLYTKVYSFKRDKWLGACK